MATQRSPSTSETFWAAVAAAVEKIPVIGPAIRVGLLTDRKRTLRVLAVAAFVLVIYPICLPLIAAILINRGVLFSLHEPYAATIRTAIRVKEATDTELDNSGLYKRLDYYQVIDIKSNGEDAQQLIYPVEAWQRVTFQVQEVHLSSSNGACELPMSLQAKGTDLVELGLGDQSIQFIKISNESNTDEHLLTASVWKQIIDSGAEQGKLRVSFKPVPELKTIATACHRGDLELTVKVTVKVFKDLVPHAAGPSAAQLS